MNLLPGMKTAALTALTAVLALSGCGTSTKTVTVGGTPSSTTGGIVSNETTSGSNTTSTPTGPVVHLSAFRSPTGNIGCMLFEDQARCDIGHRNWPLPGRPKSCPTVVDFGQGLEIGAQGPARLVCAGDTARDPHSPVLAYGTISMVGPFECISATSGMTCSRPADGRGFFISVQTYRTF